jgi:hypothetical protein
MARSEARLAVSIWSDGDFLALSPNAQRLFMFLLSQPDLAHDGVIALRVRRWSKAAAGLTSEQIWSDLGELEKTRFVVIDEDAEELLVRSFIRRDKVYRQPNVLRSAADHAKGLTSPLIVRALAAELARIGAADDIPAGSAAILAEMRAALRQPQVPAGDEGPVNPAPETTAKPSVGTPGERGVVTDVSSASPSPVPQASDPRPRPSAGGRAEVLGEPPDRCSNHIDDPDPPSCGRCAGARRAHAKWLAREAARRRNAPHCRRHRGQPADNCGPCRSERLAEEA